MPQLTSEAYQFVLEEINATHALCDRCQVPREIDRSVLSFAQRVAILAGVHEGLLKHVGNPVTTLH